MKNIAVLIGSRAAPHGDNISLLELFNKKTDVDYIVNDHLYFSILLEHGDKVSNKWETNDAYHLTMLCPLEQNGKNGEVILEIECPKAGSSGEYLLNNIDIFCDNVSSMYSISNYINIKSLTLRACTKTLTQLKKSHLIVPSKKWNKNMMDYSKLKAQYGSIYHEDYFNTLFKLRRQEVVERTKKNPNLNTSKNEFFDTKGVRQIFDHDSIHEAVAIGDAPAYTYMLEGEVKCSKKLWDRMSLFQKENCVLEESAVLALERSIIPSMYLGKKAAPIDKVFKYAMYKVCTTITSGWFRDYAIEIYPGPNSYDYSYEFVHKFINGMEKGIVKKL